MQYDFIFAYLRLSRDDKEKIYNKRKVKCILRQRSDKYVGRIFDSTRIGKMMKGYQ